ncbi:MAG: HK97 gp10 family phage protein [Peptostreptococcaceae bacterium]|nr:HK97 gp10 family phage protein [Peptostreptococcaceae bacterium]
MSFRSYRREVSAEMTRAEQRALEKIGLYVDGEAVSRSPVISGRLKSSWEHEVQEKSVIVANNTEYAAFVEFGTSRQRAQRILTGSVEENVDNIRSITERELHRVGG